jgi:transcriptional regulator with XRE-family HTH domain
MAKGRFKSQGLQALHDQFIGDDPERIASFECAIADASIAQNIYDLRTKAGLSQRELATLVGTTASVICRLEDADYEGHSMAMLRRIAAAVGQRVEVRFVPLSSSAAGDAAPGRSKRGKGSERPTSIRYDEMTAEEKTWLADIRAEEDRANAAEGRPIPSARFVDPTIGETNALLARRAEQESSGSGRQSGKTA